MAPPTIAPPISPAATPAATPRCALAGVAASEPAIVATATKAVNVFFMSRALLEMAPAASAGFKVTNSPYSKLDVSLRSAPQSIESKRFSGCRLEKRFFQANGQNRVISGPVCKEDERGSTANPHPANPPAIAVPEALSLPDAVVIRDIGRTAVIAVAGSIIIAGSISIIARAGKRAANDGAADQSGSDAGGNHPATGFGGLGQRHGRYGEGGDGSECDQFLLHDEVTFLNRTRTADKAVPRSESSI